MTSAADIILGGASIDGLENNAPDDAAKDEKAPKRPQINAADIVLGGSTLDDWVDTVPLSSVLTKEFMGEQKDSAGFLTLLQSGIVDDPQTKIKIYASSRFPNEPEEKRLKRYGIHDGNIVYMGDDGKLYPETAKNWFQTIKKFTADTGAHLPSIIMSTVLAATGPGGAALGAAGGEGVRKAIAATAYGEPQTAMDNTISMGTEGLMGGAGEVVGSNIGRAYNYLGAKRGGKLAAAAGRNRADIDVGATRRMEALGRQHGVDLYPPQTTGNKRLADKFNLLGDIDASADIIQGARETQAQQVDYAVYRYLNELAPDTTTPTTAGKGVVDASRKAVERPIKVRAAKAKPLYEKAFKNQNIIDESEVANRISRNQNQIKILENTKPDPDVDAMVSTLKERGIPTMQQKGEGAQAYASRIAGDYRRIVKKPPPMKGGGIDTEKISALKSENNALERALKGEAVDGIDLPMKVKKVDTTDALKEIQALKSSTVPDDPSWKALDKIEKMIGQANGDLRKLDRVKRSSIDSILDRVDPHGKNQTLRMEVSRVKEKLLSSMDDVSPDYKKARKIFEEDSIPVNRLGSKNIVADVAKLENDQVANAARRLFSSVNSGPENVARARKLIKKESPEAWDAALRTYLQDIFENAKGSVTTGQTTNAGGHFWKNVFGNERQRKILRAAMTDQQYGALTDFMEVLKRSGIILGKESATATRQIALEEMKRQGESRMIMAATRPLYTPKRLIGDTVNAMMFGKYAKELAEAMTSERAARQLARMKQLKPGTAKMLNQLSTFLSMTIGGDFVRGDDFSGDVPPPSLKDRLLSREASPQGQ